MKRNLSILICLFASLAFVVTVAVAHHYAMPAVNRADANTIARVVYDIGPVRAAAIVRERDENGPFKSWADFARRMEGADIGPVIVANTKRAMRLRRAR